MTPLNLVIEGADINGDALTWDSPDGRPEATTGKVAHMKFPARGTLARQMALHVMGSIAVAAIGVTAILLINDAAEEHIKLHHHLAWFIAGVCVFLALIMLIYGFELRRQISAPIEQLVGAMRLVTTQQNYDIRLSLHSSEELDTLANGFNCMLAEIQRRDEELLRNKQVLESELAARKYINAQLEKARDEAEAANRAKSAFLASMSHEIRTPMNGVIGMTELVMQTSLNPEQREYMAMVKSSAESLLSIINDILDFSKIEAGRVELEKFEFNLHDLVSETLRTFAPSAHRKDLELVYDIRSGVPENVVGDPLRLRQVLLNIISNAIKFTERGEVAVVIDRDPGSGRDCLNFVVRDTGIGIPLEKRQAIFEPFAQADSSQTRKYGGTGLGLAISNRLVTLMQGSIWVDSRVGEGTEFHITLPLPAGAAVSREIPAFLKGMNALVVDDNLTNRRVMAGMLNSFGMKADSVESAMRGRSAMEAAAAEGSGYKLVIIDGEMPVMDGFQLAEIIQRTPALSTATVVMLTCGTRQPEQIARCRQLGVHAYLLKPIRRSELLKVMTRVLSPTGIEAAGEAQAEIAPQRLRPLSILAAEDNRVNQRLLVRLLEKEGHTVQVAENGEAAVALSAERNFDAILMDVQMPKLDGLDAARQIRTRERSSGGHVPIIALTAYAMRGDREKCLQAGMDMYIAKPLDKQELFRALEKCVAPGEHDELQPHQAEPILK